MANARSTVRLLGGLPNAEVLRPLDMVERVDGTLCGLFVEEVYASTPVSFPGGMVFSFPMLQQAVSVACRENGLWRALPWLDAENPPVVSLRARSERRLRIMSQGASLLTMVQQSSELSVAGLSGCSIAGQWFHPGGATSPVCVMRRSTQDQLSWWEPVPTANGMDLLVAYSSDALSTHLARIRCPQFICQEDPSQIEEMVGGGDAFVHGTAVAVGSNVWAFEVDVSGTGVLASGPNGVRTTFNVPCLPITVQNGNVLRRAVHASTLPSGAVQVGLTCTTGAVVTAQFDPALGAFAPAQSAMTTTVEDMVGFSLVDPQPAERQPGAVVAYNQDMQVWRWTANGREARSLTEGLTVRPDTVTSLLVTSSQGFPRVLFEVTGSFSVLEPDGTGYVSRPTTQVYLVDTQPYGLAALE